MNIWRILWWTCFERARSYSLTCINGEGSGRFPDKNLVNFDHHLIFTHPSEPQAGASTWPGLWWCVCTVRVCVCVRSLAHTCMAPPGEDCNYRQSVWQQGASCLEITANTNCSRWTASRAHWSLEEQNRWRPIRHRSAIVTSSCS